MRIILLSTTCFLLWLNSAAQNYNDSFIKDSSGIISLNEVTVITKQSIQQRRLVNFFKAQHAATLEDILSRLPEISLTRRGAYGMEPGIRGFSGGQINVLVDGMRIHGACTDKMDPVSIYIEPLNLETLELQSGANGFLSGSSIGGTINMKIAEPGFQKDKQVQGTISSGYQSATKSFFEAIRLNYSSGKWAWRGSATYRKSQDYRSGGGHKIKYSQYEKINYSLSVKYLQTKHNSIKADLLLDDGWNIGYPALPMDVGFASAKIGSISFVHENRNNRLSKILVKGYANEIKHFMDDTKRPNVPIHMDMPGKSRTAGMFAEAEIKWTPKQSMMLRADASSTFLTASMTMYQAGQLPMYMLTWPDNKRKQAGFSATYSLQFDSTLHLQVNGRADFVHSFLATQEAKNQVSILGTGDEAKNNFLKNISFLLSKKITSALKITGSLAYMERIATTSEAYGFYLFNASDGYDYIGNAALKPETAIQAEASATYTFKKHRLHIATFYNRLHHYIYSKVENNLSVMTAGANGVKSYLNIPHASIAGFEASLLLKPTAVIDVISTLRYTYAEDDKRKALAGISPIKNISSLRYQPKRIFYLLETEIAGNQHRINADAGEDKTPAYMVFNYRMGAPVQYRKTTIELQAGIENIFDKKYHEHLDWGNIPRAGINFYIQAKLTF